MRKSLSGFPFFSNRAEQFRYASTMAFRHGGDFAAVMVETQDPRVAACATSVARGSSEDFRDSFRSVPED